MSEAVKEPSHYASATGQAWDVLDVWFADDPLLWNCGKYLARAGKKGDKLTDLLKAQSYLNRRIEQMQREANPTVTKTIPQIMEMLHPNLPNGSIADAYPPHDAWDRNI